MTEQILSPGVFTNENDLSFVPTGIAQIGAAFVGPTLKGPAFVPTQVTSFTQFTTKFGQETPSSYIPYAVRNYLRSSGVATVTRVLGDGGWAFDGTVKKLSAITSGSTILSVFHPTLNANDAQAELSSTFATGSFQSFGLTLSGSSVFNKITASLNPSSTMYLTKILGNNPAAKTGSAFPYLSFQNFLSSSIATGISSFSDSVTISTNINPCTFTSSNQGGYQEAITPWIISAGGIRLFRFHHISPGFSSNTDVKVAVTNINISSVSGVYSTFSILLRDFNDTDNVPSILEQYNTVSLNTNDNSSYVAFKIGDRHSRYDSTQGKVLDFGDFTNSSNYVYIEVSDAVKNGSLDPSVYPGGFEAPFETVAGFFGFSLPAATTIQSNATSPVYSGFNFSNPDNLNYLNPVPKEAVQGRNTSFFVTGSDNKFMVPFQGGTDGMNYATIKNTGGSITPSNMFGFDLSTSTAPGALSYAQAINILSNAEAYDFNLFLMPGVINTLHPSVVQNGLSMVQSRTDAVYLLDLCGANDTIATAVQNAASLDSNYGATYYPWVRIIDSSNGKQVAVPPSVVVPQAYAYNDKVGQEWTAVAGLNRGGLGGVVSVVNKLTQPERNILYPARINPIASFPDTGISIWGQKTLQVANTSLNRINVRRLLINLRKFTASVGKFVVFEPNTTATQNKFKASVTPYFATVQSKQGVYSIRVVMDDSNNTADVIDQNQLVGAIFLQPTKTSEAIILEFNINPTGTTI